MIRLRAHALSFALAASAIATNGSARADDAAPPMTAAPTAAPSPPPPAPPQTQRRGVVVVAVGDGASQQAAAALARSIYATRSLTPSVTEAEVATLTGRAAPADASERVVSLASLRASLRDPVDDVAARAVLFQIASITGARALLVVTHDGTSATARLARVTKDAARFDAARFSPRASDPPGAADDWTETVPSVEALLGPEPAAPKKPAAAPKPPPPPPEIPPDETDDTQFYESPWFWVALGSATAIGVTALVISQTVDTSSGSVHLTGKMPLSISF